ncbi:caffeic acid 3-O-methyltransferase-like [Prosopis cineraria]|uniref:caffeic acid 3-O-methyltransferase-like n=1 Tax=Prosopis cineraria TaxID=364024 RepID=UPI00240FBB30|nr:caffeic acid 3-O-methyltransferase-like [Prosopis cineraria]
MAPPLKSDSILTNGESNHLRQPHAGHVREDEESFVSAMQLVTSSVLSMSLQAAIELGVFDAIAGAGEDAKLSAKDIAAVVSCTNPEAPSMLDRLLSLLASHSVLHCSIADNQRGTKQRIYSLSPVSKYFVSDANGVSLRHLMSLVQDKVFLESWRELKGAIKEGGIAFNRVHRMHAFEYPSKDARFNDAFNKGMHDSTILIMSNMLKCYDGFEGLDTVVDVGGGLGINLSLITSKYPHIQGINFDLPHVIQNAPTCPRVEHVGGDMFESVPQGHAIFMKWILHDWSDEHCAKLLKTCYKAIPEDGKVIIVDAILPDEPNTSVAVKTALQGDVLMMTQNPGGKERTQHEFLHLAAKSGFARIQFVCRVCGFWVMELRK